MIRKKKLPVLTSPKVKQTTPVPNTVTNKAAILPAPKKDTATLQLNRKILEVDDDDDDDAMRKHAGPPPKKKAPPPKSLPKPQNASSSPPAQDRNPALDNRSSPPDDETADLNRAEFWKIREAQKSIHFSHSPNIPNAIKVTKKNDASPQKPLTSSSSNSSSDDAEKSAVIAKAALPPTRESPSSSQSDTDDLKSRRHSLTPAQLPKEATVTKKKVQQIVTRDSGSDSPPAVKAPRTDAQSDEHEISKSPSSPMEWLQTKQSRRRPYQEEVHAVKVSKHAGIALKKRSKSPQIMSSQDSETIDLIAARFKRESTPIPMGLVPASKPDPRKDPPKTTLDAKIAPDALELTSPQVEKKSLENAHSSPKMAPPMPKLLSQSSSMSDLTSPAAIPTPELPQSPIVEVLPVKSGVELIPDTTPRVKSPIDFLSLKPVAKPASDHVEIASGQNLSARLDLPGESHTESGQTIQMKKASEVAKDPVVPASGEYQSALISIPSAGQVSSIFSNWLTPTKEESEDSLDISKKSDAFGSTISAKLAKAKETDSEMTRLAESNRRAQLDAITAGRKAEMELMKLDLEKRKVEMELAQAKRALELQSAQLQQKQPPSPAIAAKPNQDVPQKWPTTTGTSPAGVATITPPSVAAKVPQLFTTDSPIVQPESTKTLPAELFTPDDPESIPVKLGRSDSLKLYQKALMEKVLAIEATTSREIESLKVQQQMDTKVTNAHLDTLHKELTSELRACVAEDLDSMKSTLVSVRQDLLKSLADEMKKFYATVQVENVITAVEDIRARNRELALALSSDFKQLSFTVSKLERHGQLAAEAQKQSKVNDAEINEAMQSYIRTEMTKSQRTVSIADARQLARDSLRRGRALERLLRVLSNLGRSKEDSGAVVSWTLNRAMTLWKNRTRSLRAVLPKFNATRRIVHVLSWSQGREMLACLYLLKTHSRNLQSLNNDLQRTIQEDYARNYALKKLLLGTPDFHQVTREVSLAPPRVRNLTHAGQLKCPWLII